MNKAKNQLSINLIASVVVFCVQFLINFWLSPFVVSRLGEEAQGFITLANDFTQYATLVTVAVNSMASRFISIEYNKGNTEKANKYFASVFWMNCIMAVVFLFSAFFIVLNLERLININYSLIFDVKCTFALSFLNLIVSCLSTCFVATTFVTNRMDYHAFVQIGSNILKVIILVGSFMLFPPHVFYVSIATLTASIFILVVYFFLRKKLLPSFSISSSFFSFSCVIELAKAGVWILVSNISSILLGGLDLIVANLNISQIAMGRLSMAKTIPTAVGGLLGFLSNIFAASFTKHVAKNDNNALVQEIHTTCRILGFFLTVPFAGIIVYGPCFLKLWLPNNIYDDAAIKEVYILMILVLANVIVNAYMYSIHSLFIAMNKVKNYSLMILVSSVISFTLTLFVVKNSSLGIYAIAGISTLVLGFTNLYLVPRYAEKVLNLKRFELLKTIYKSYFVLLIIGLMFYAISKTHNISNWIQFVVYVVVSALIGYLICGFIMLRKNERIRIINKILRK